MQWIGQIQGDLNEGCIQATRAQSVIEPRSTERPGTPGPVVAPLW
jgi:hypothetical protein